MTVKAICVDASGVTNWVTEGSIYEGEFLPGAMFRFRVENSSGPLMLMARRFCQVSDIPDEANPKDALGMKKVNEFLVPPVLSLHTARAFEDGAAKYGPYNWREKKVRASIYIAAAKRHINAWLDGEEIAKDSGVHHLGHAAACMAILLDAQAGGNLIDDRPKPGAYSALVEEFKKKI